MILDVHSTLPTNDGVAETLPAEELISKENTTVNRVAAAPRTPIQGETESDPEAENRKRQRAQAIVLPIVAILFVGLFWEAYSHREGVTLPGPVMTIRESWKYIAHPFFDNGPNDKGLGWHLLSSLKRVGIGYALASIIGVTIGIILGLSNAMQRAFDPIFQVLRTIPPLAWLPISLATFNEANPSAIFVIFITSIWPIIINTAVGVRGIPAEYRNVGRVYEVNGSRYFFKILLPAAAPFIFTGLRIAVGMAWLGIVASEMLTGGVGIGFFIWDSWNSSRMTDIVVSVIYVGLVGLMLDRIMAGVQHLVGTKQD